MSLAGGRVTGSDIISDLIQELHASVEAASQFEGEMQMLAGYSRYPFSWAEETLNLEPFHLPGRSLCNASEVI